jgi:uncharacterized protein
MRLEFGRESGNVEDRRGVTLKRGAVGGGAVIVALVLTLLGAPQEAIRDILGGGSGQVTEQEGPPVQGTPAEESAKKVVAVSLGSTEDVWNKLFSATGSRYQEPKLRLFSQAVQSACGIAGSAVGPFYCPPDKRVYIDLAFFAELDRRFGAPGDFAQAYVVAHEVGHHVQNLLGISEKSQRQRARLPEAEANHLSVLVELQADCFAGIWAHHADQRLIEQGDVEEGLRAAAAIGDDTLQRKTRGQVSPESFTHGSSEQRVRWFRQGMKSGRMDDCNTFGSREI